MNMAGQQTALANPGSLFNDSNPWKALNQDEKVERTRDIVRTLLQKINDLERQLRQVISQVQEHRHNQDGEPVITKKLSGHSGSQEESYPQGIAPAVYGPTLPDGPDAYF